VTSPQGRSGSSPDADEEESPDEESELSNYSPNDDIKGFF
jgi:hypothetical protein